MDITHIRPTWLTALLPLLAVYQYGDREIVRAELFRMALSADAAAKVGRRAAPHRQHARPGRSRNRHAPGRVARDSPHGSLRV